MTPEKQRIAIAEACGWEFVKWGKNGLKILHPANRLDQVISIPLNGRTIDAAKIDYVSALPNYLNDLNAIHEAFRHLGRPWKIEQIEDGFVCTVQFGPQNKPVVVAGLELAKVMGEAFLKSLNLWRL